MHGGIAAVGQLGCWGTVGSLVSTRWDHWLMHIGITSQCMVGSLASAQWDHWPVHGASLCMVRTLADAHWDHWPVHGGSLANV